MEFGIGQILLVGKEGKFFDRVRIDEVEETGDGRILHGISTVRTQKPNYKIGEVRDEKWEVFSGKSLDSARHRRDPDRPTLTLEIV